MRFSSLRIFLAIELAQLMFAETTPDDLNWGLLEDPANLMNSAAAATSDNLFSDSNLDPLAENSSINDENFFSADDFINADISNNSADPACLSLSSELLSDPNQLQIRSPGQCVNPLEKQDPDTANAAASNDRQSNRDPLGNLYLAIFKTPVSGAKRDPHLCPFERYGPRPYPLCDSGFSRDVIQDDVYWIIDLRNAWIYDGECRGSIEKGWCCSEYYGVRERLRVSLDMYRLGEDCWPFDEQTLQDRSTP